MLWCSGVVRVGLFAKRDIEAGEELLYNYNYPESKVQYFWEPGERPESMRPVVPPLQERTEQKTTRKRKRERESDDATGLSPIVRRTKREKVNGEDSSSQLEAFERPTSTTGTPKVDESEGYSTPTQKRESRKFRVSNNHSSTITVDATSRPSKNYPLRSRTPAEGTQRLKEEDHSDRDISTLSAKTKAANKKARGLVVRQRRIGPNDGRFSGKAQKLAWETRRRNEDRAGPDFKGQ